MNKTAIITMYFEFQAKKTVVLFSLGFTLGFGLFGSFFAWFGFVFGFLFLYNHS